MRGKIAFVVGAAVGYVLGTRAGRERYEQIKVGAQRVWETEPVQRGVHAVQGAVDDRVEALKDYGIDLGGKIFSGLARRSADKKSGADKKSNAETKERSETGGSGAGAEA